jgi:hypothetical protein
LGANPDSRANRKEYIVLPRLKQLIIGTAALAALALGGSAIAGAATSTAPASTSPSTATTEPADMHAGARDRAGFTAADAPGTRAHENAEKAITGASASKAQAAAVASVGGTAGAVTGDFTGNGYEVAVTKSDGSHLTVRLDSAFKVDREHGAR